MKDGPAGPDKSYGLSQNQTCLYLTFKLLSAFNNKIANFKLFRKHSGRCVLQVDFMFLFKDNFPLRAMGSKFINRRQR